MPRLVSPAVLLALPFLIAIAALHGLTVAIHTFHDTDESVYHVPTIMRFAAELPSPRLTGYPAAQTPLFHLVFAALTKLLGAARWRLRLVNAAFSLAAVLVLYRLLARRLADRWAAFSVAGLFALSPYFFGISFLLLTDNLAWLLVLLALERLDAFQRRRDFSAFAWFCVWACLAILTRQNAAWLLPPGLVIVLAGRGPRRAKLLGLGGLALALAPYAALVAYWGDLAPPGSSDATCGLCAGGSGSAFTLRAPEFALAVIAVYAAVLHGPRLLAAPRAFAAGAAAGVAALAIQPLHRTGPLDAGWLWQVSAHGPVVGGTSWLFWLLVPLGGGAIAALLARVGDERLPAAAAASFLASTLVVSLVFQKYVDPAGLLLVALATRPGDLKPLLSRAGTAALAAAFAVYAITFPASRDASAAVRCSTSACSGASIGPPRSWARRPAHRGRPAGRRVV